MEGFSKSAGIEMAEQTGPVLRETFAPLLYAMPYTNFDRVIELHNGVPQGLASSIFSNDVREVEHFLSAKGSDCGIVNVQYPLYPESQLRALRCPLRAISGHSLSPIDIRFTPESGHCAQRLSSCPLCAQKWKSP